MTAPRYTGCKRPREQTLTLLAPDAEKRANAASLAADAGALVPYVPSPAAGKPINVVPLSAVAPKLAPEARAEPSWLRKGLLPYLNLRFDLPAHFIAEKVTTATDLDPHQNRFRLPSEAVTRDLRPVLSPLELKAANLLHEEAVAPRPRLPKPSNIPGKKAARRKKRQGKKHGGLPVLVVEPHAGIRELQLSRWESSRGTVIKGEGYLDFINIATSRWMTSSRSGPSRRLPFVSSASTCAMKALSMF